MIVLFEKMAMLVILLALGYLCARMKLVGPEFNKGLSKLVMNLFLVGMILSSVINKDMELSGFRGTDRLSDADFNGAYLPRHRLYKPDGAPHKKRRPRYVPHARFVYE